MRKSPTPSVIRFFLLLVLITLSPLTAVSESLDGHQARQIARDALARLAPGISLQLRLTHTENTADGTPAVYVFNNDGGGFILIAADNRPDPVLGYNREGSFTIGKDYAPHKAFLANYALEMTPSHALQRRLKRQQATDGMDHSPLRGVEGISEGNEESLPLEVEPLLGNIRWDQGYPFYL